MDRSMKVMFGMMTVAICLLAITMMGNQSQQAYAGEYVGGGDRGTEPTIVWFGVTHDTQNTDRIVYHRLWSDGLLQYRRVRQHGCYVDFPDNCGGWTDVPSEAGGDGVACGADVNSDSVVDVTDLLAVIGEWGVSTVCEPTYECIDLNNLPSGMGG